MDTGQHDAITDTSLSKPDDLDVTARAGDLLVGANAIRAFLIELGIPRKTADPYYLKRTGRWPIGNTGGDGGRIIASKRRLLQHADQLTRGSAA
jgi:hypothetical protein